MPVCAGQGSVPRLRTYPLGSGQVDVDLLRLNSEPWDGRYVSLVAPSSGDIFNLSGMPPAAPALTASPRARRVTGPAWRSAFCCRAIARTERLLVIGGSTAEGASSAEVRVQVQLELFASMDEARRVAAQHAPGSGPGGDARLSDLTGLSEQVRPMTTACRRAVHALTPPTLPRSCTRASCSMASSVCWSRARRPAPAPRRAQRTHPARRARTACWHASSTDCLAGRTQPPPQTHRSAGAPACVRAQGPPRRRPQEPSSKPNPADPSPARPCPLSAHLPSVRPPKGRAPPGARANPPRPARRAHRRGAPAPPPPSY